ncbi:MAG TPA: vWA domain-containing protein [Gaiellaceae bacterium]|nr:vWA domain-containing protein [Gaiellaceae bacterium]
MSTRERLRSSRFSSRTIGVDTHDVGSFRAVVGRTGLIRLVLAGGALALVLAAVAAARDPATTERALIPQDRVGVVVLDLSLSITDEDYTAIRRTLRRLVAEEASIGLVVFSDVPYELLPPGTPAVELEPLLRLLVAPRLGPVQNPWTQTFRAGTRISVALELARSTLERDEVDSGSILLVSDLETAPEDVPALARTISDLDRGGIGLSVVPLAPSSDALNLFAGYVDEDAVDGFAQQAPNGEQPDAGTAGMKTPVTLLVLGLLAFALLAAHERFSGRLALPRPAADGGSPS